MSYHYQMNANNNEFFDSTSYIPQMQMHHGYQDFYNPNGTSQQQQPPEGAVMQDNQDMIVEGGYGGWRQDWSSTSSQPQQWMVQHGMEHPGHMGMSHGHPQQMMGGGNGHVDSFRPLPSNLCYMEEPPSRMPPKKVHPPPLPRLLSRSTPKPFRCNTCGKAFSQAANLTAHKRIHTGEKPFSCSVCRRPFSQSSSLVTHRRTHTGERPYPCGQCDKAFTDSSTLTKHLRTHTGNKPYACNICMMKFTQSGNLHRHMKTHK